MRIVLFLSALALSLLLMLNGCTPVKTASGDPSDIIMNDPGQKTAGFASAAQQDKDSTSDWAARVAELPEGSSALFDTSPFGPVLVEVGQTYCSGLGHECRSTVLTAEGKRTSLALCRDDSGIWDFVPSVFENLPR